MAMPMLALNRLSGDDFVAAEEYLRQLGKMGYFKLVAEELMKELTNAVSDRTDPDAVTKLHDYRANSALLHRMQTQADGLNDLQSA